MIHFVTGKGGVGKSTLSCLLALHQARLNRTVLLVELDPDGPFARWFGTKKFSFTPQKLKKNIYGMVITPKLALKEYIISQIKFSTLYNLFFDNRFVQFFRDAAPGISEISIIGKLFYLEQETMTGKPKWDDIIVDAPATGHGLYLFKSPKVFLDIAQVGTISVKSKNMYEMICSSERSRIHLVTLAEELPVQETIEYHEEIKSLQLPKGLLFLNKYLPNSEFSLTDFHQSQRLKNSSLAAIIEQTLEKYEKRALLQRPQIATLEQKVSKDLVKVNWHLDQCLDLHSLEKISLDLQHDVIG
ncbi:MAG: ArsA family ATPase [Deltaproteobacteria bacterium]|nr:ArsA family ATPase [Deltaproteobacteria bacterium]